MNQVQNANGDSLLEIDLDKYQSNLADSILADSIKEEELRLQQLNFNILQQSVGQTKNQLKADLLK